MVRAFLTAADYIIAMQELKRYAMEGTEDFINKVLVPIVTNLKSLIFKALEFCLFFSQCDVPLNTQTIKKTIDKYGESNIFKSIVKGSDRLEMYGENGIQLNDYVDRRWWAILQTSLQN